MGELRSTPKLEHDELLESVQGLIQRVQQTGQEVDDLTIAALAEATGAPQEYIRVALLASRQELTQKRTTLKDLYLSLDPLLRKLVTGTALGSLAGISMAFRRQGLDTGGLWGFFMVAPLIIAIYAAGVSATKRLAMVTGVAYGVGLFLAQATLITLIGMFRDVAGGVRPEFFIIGALVGGAVGALAHEFVSKSGRKLGLKPATAERQALLQQLLELQDQLKTHTQEVTFLSLDMVGSTEMKSGAEPLAVEYTFTEYHNYVQQIVEKHEGKIHSTAGDGVTCVFNHPAQAFVAARQIQAGLFELNFHRNKLGKPIRLRAGIHHGSVTSADGQVENINFSSVIDLASHLQKNCPIGCVLTSTSAARIIPDPAAYSDEIVMVDGLEARIFRSPVSVDITAFKEPNPRPI